MHNPDPRTESIGALALCNRVVVTRPKTGPKLVSVEVATLVRWSLTPKHLRDPRGKSVMRTRLERSAQFRALPPSLRETMRTLLAIADAPEVGRSGMVHGFAKVEAIAQRRGCSRSQAGRDLARLERLGWIAKEIREPRRFNLGLVFTVFDAPMASAVALVGVPKGPNARSGLGAPMRSPQDGAPMRSPNRGRQCESPPPPTPPRGGEAGGGDARRTPEPTPSEPTPATPPEPCSGQQHPNPLPEPTPSEPCSGQQHPNPLPPTPLRDWLSGLAHQGRTLRPSTVSDLAGCATLATMPLERLDATWRQCRASGVRDPLAVLVARLKRGEIADAPRRDARRSDWNTPRLADLAADAVPIADAKANARLIREAMRLRPEPSPAIA